MPEKPSLVGFGASSVYDALRAERIELGLERALRFTWEECARQTLAVYRKVLAAQSQA
jgi:glycosyltransferase involved in cell wall biosynthesis